MILQDLLPERSWVERANCAEADPDVFFPVRGQDVAQAKAVCRDCTVRAECLEYALVHVEKLGVWGGTSERERRRMRSARRRR